MKGITGWGYRPYRPALAQKETQLPFVVRIAPFEDGFEAEFLDNGAPGAAHLVRWRPRGSEQPFETADISGSVFTVGGLAENAEYEFRVERADGSGSSAVRLVRTGPVPGAKNGRPGTVVNYLHPDDAIYSFSGHSLCSPSILKLEDGTLLAAMDVFAGGAPQNLTLLFRSEDGGASWRYLTDLFPCFWPLLFLHKGRLYLLAFSTEYGDILIGESKDRGLTWSKPSHIFVGSCSPVSAGWHHAPLPVITHNGRLWTAVDYGAWTVGGHSNSVLSIDEDADLLVSENWSVSEPVAYDPEWPGAPKGRSAGMIEGNMVVGRGGELLNILRIGLIGCEPSHGVAAVLEADASDPERAMRFHSFIPLPSGSNSKTHLLYDEVSDRYFAIGNICVDPAKPGQRNVLALQSSRDLIDWDIADILLDYRDEDADKVGFQYISFIFDGDDLLYLSRTALNDAYNYHDANYSVFHRVKDFRRLLR